MKKILTSAAKITCNHLTGFVNWSPTQDFVRIEGKPVLTRIKLIPEIHVITGCTNMGFTIKPCTFTLPPEETGYSSLVFVEGSPVCLDTITGLTDGTPPGIVKYSVRSPGQSFVSTEE